MFAPLRSGALTFYAPLRSGFAPAGLKLLMTDTDSLNMCRLPLVTIRGFDHHLYTVLQNKVVLNNFDSKMYICDCNIHTFFYGSKDLNSVCKKCN